MKARLLKEIVVIDLELTCWNFKEDGQVPEIIEIGACVLDVRSGEITKPRSLLVKPQFGDVSPFCTKLTGITPDMVADGMSFPEAMQLLREEYRTEVVPMGAFGRDWRLLHRECDRNQISTPLSDRGGFLINIAALVQQRMKSSNQVSLRAACEHLDIPFEGQHHRGLDDAMMAARILRSLMEPRVVPQNERQATPRPGCRA